MACLKCGNPTDRHMQYCRACAQQIFHEDITDRVTAIPVVKSKQEFTKQRPLPLQIQKPITQGKKDRTLLLSLIPIICVLSVILVVGGVVFAFSTSTVSSGENNTTLSNKKSTLEQRGTKVPISVSPTVSPTATPESTPDVTPTPASVVTTATVSYPSPTAVVQTVPNNESTVHENLTYEAENQRLTKPAYVENCPNCSGQYMVFNVGSDGVGSLPTGKVFFDVNVTKGGNYTVTVWYCNVKPMTGYVAIQGISDPVYYPNAETFCYDGGNPKQTTLTVQLQAGQNTLEFGNSKASGSSSNSRLGIDKIVISN